MLQQMILIMKTSERAFQWKMKFNPDPTKQVQEIIFNKKKTVSIHSAVYFNDTPANSTATHKYLGIILDSKQVMKIIFNLSLAE